MHYLISQVVAVKFVDFSTDFPTQMSLFSRRMLIMFLLKVKPNLREVRVKYKTKMEYVEHLCDKLNLDRFGDNQVIRDASKVVGLQPRHFIAAVMGASLLLLFVPYVTAIISGVTTFLIPAYKSYKALESTDEKDDKRWLTYWIVFGFFHSFDFVLVNALSFIPGYTIVRTLILIALYVNKDIGRDFLFEKVVSPVISAVEPHIQPLATWMDEHVMKETEKPKQD